VLLFNKSVYINTHQDVINILVDIQKYYKYGHFCIQLSSKMVTDLAIFDLSFHCIDDLFIYISEKKSDIHAEYLCFTILDHRTSWSARSFKRTQIQLGCEGKKLIQVIEVYKKQYKYHLDWQD